MMMSQQVKLGAALPGGGVGAVLTLSQAPCNDPNNPGACCNSKNTTCAAWAGAHLVSAGCIQWGVLEIEAAFNMPANAGGFYFTATYVVYGATDPAWNEIDIGMSTRHKPQRHFCNPKNLTRRSLARSQSTTRLATWSSTPRCSRPTRTRRRRR